MHFVNASQTALIFQIFLISVYERVLSITSTYYLLLVQMGRRLFIFAISVNVNVFNE